MSPTRPHRTRCGRGAAASLDDDIIDAEIVDGL
jgi:hypothetical protein